MEADGALANRMCIVTRACRDEGDLIRFVRSPEGVVVPDLARRLPGRGVWVSLDRERVAEAVRRNLFARGFATSTAAPADLPDRVGGLLRKAALSYLSLARKAGEAVAGSTKVAAMLTSGQARLIVHAREAADDGCRKLDRLAGPDVERVIHFEGRELDLAFGRSNVIHAAVAKGRLAETLLAAAGRSARYEARVGSLE
jgi:hypothetical protein